MPKDSRDFTQVCLAAQNLCNLRGKEVGVGWLHELTVPLAKLLVATSPHD